MCDVFRSRRQFDASGTDSIPQTEAERVGCHRGASTPLPGTVHHDRTSKESNTVCRYSDALNAGNVAGIITNDSSLMP